MSFTQMVNTPGPAWLSFRQSRNPEKYNNSWIPDRKRFAPLSGMMAVIFVK